MVMACSPHRLVPAVLLGFALTACTPTVGSPHPTYNPAAAAPETPADTAPVIVVADAPTNPPRPQPHRPVAAPVAATPPAAPPLVVVAPRRAVEPEQHPTTTPAVVTPPPTTVVTTHARGPFERVETHPDYPPAAAPTTAP